MSGRAAATSERGSISILGIGAFLLALALIVIAVDATFLQLRRVELWNLADGAALAAADELDDSDYYAGELADPAAGLDVADAPARQAARRYLEAATPTGSGLEATLVAAGAGGGAAHVTLHATVNPPIIGALLTSWGSGIGIEATGRARAVDPAAAPPSGG